MILFLKCLGEKFDPGYCLLPSRPVWLADEVDVMQEMGLEQETPGELPPDQDAVAAAIDESMAKRNDLLLENENNGEAADFAKEFEKFSQKSESDAFVRSLVTGREVAGVDTIANPDNWLSSDPIQLADMLEVMPHTRGWQGRVKFFEGLRAYEILKDEVHAESEGREKPSEDKIQEAHEKYNKSKAALEKIVRIIRKQIEDKRLTDADTRTQAEKGPLPNVLQNGISTMWHNWERATGKEKLVYGGAIAIGIMLIAHFKDTKVPILSNIWKDFTWKKAGVWAVSLWTVNFLSGKLSKDGRTLLERADFLRDIDDLQKDNIARSFVVEAGADKDNEKYRAFLKLQDIDVKLLYHEYVDARNRSGKKQIPPENLGFSNKDLTGEAIYSIAEEFIKAVGYNYGLNIRREQNPNYGNELTAADATLYENYDKAKIAFEYKYFSESQLGGQEVTLLEAIYYEFRTRNWKAIIERGEAQRMSKRAAKRGKEVASSVRDITVENLAALQQKAGQVWEKTWDDYLVPSGQWTKGKFNKYMNVLGITTKELAEETGLIKKLNKDEQEKYFDVVFPPELAVIVTESGKMTNGRVTVMGVPEVEYERKTSTEGKEIIVIEGIEFVIADGVAGNKTAADALEKSMREKVENLFAKEQTSKDKLKGHNPVWNANKKRWELSPMELTGYTILNLPKEDRDIAIRIADNQASMRFYLDDIEIKQFNDPELEHIYSLSWVERLFTEKNADLKPFLQGLEFKMHKGAYKDSNTGPYPYIKGKIGGLDFEAIIHQHGSSTKIALIERGPPVTLNFNDKQAFKALKITKKNGGDEFLENLAANIMSDGKFLKPFFDLKARMDQVSEKLGDRLALMFPTSRAWIIPTSIDVSAGVNGRVVQNAWANMIDFKMHETLDLFQSELNGKSLDKVPEEYAKHVQPVLDNLKSLWKLIDSEPDDEARAKLFDEFLSGDSVKGTKIPGLDYINYTNMDYRKLFKEFKDMIHGSEFNYAGFENIADADFSDDAHKSYAALYRVWSYLTRKFRASDPDPNQTDKAKLSAKSQATLRIAMGEIKKRLHEAQQKGHESIKYDDLLKHDTEKQIKQWINTSSLPPGTTGLNN